MIGRILRPCSAALIAAAALAAGEAGDPPRLELHLPEMLDVRQLSDVLAEHVQVVLQGDPGRAGTPVRLRLPAAEVTPRQLWDAAQRALLAAGLTTVTTGDPTALLVVPLSEAPALAQAMTRESLDAQGFPPGFATVIFTLRHLAAEPVVRALDAALGQPGQARAFGSDLRRVVVSAPVHQIALAGDLLAILDRAGSEPSVRLFRPARTEVQALQAAATAAWTALGRISGGHPPAEFQIAPDRQQLLLITASESIDAALAVVERLDQAEPVTTQAYRPAHFGLDEVAGLLQQVLRNARDPTTDPEIVSDRLTSRLVVTATAAQHARIAALLGELEQTPASARRQLRSVAIRHRPVDELAKLLTAVLAGMGGTPSAGAAVPAADGTPTAASAAAAATPAAEAAGAAKSVSIATDPSTNRLIVMGEPQQLDQLVEVIAQLDVRQTQVEVEVILAALSDGQVRELGVELMGQFSRGQTDISVGSLFGLSGGTGLARTLPTSATGLGALILRPGDYAGVLRALDTITGGDSLTRTSVVLANNARATINGVVQQPLTSINAGATVSTTSVTGTSDAGTEITVSASIAATDQVTLTYAIGQSSFLGSSTTTSDGTVIPAPKRSDSLASVATIPDGHVIALGGLSSRTRNTTQSRIPWLGEVPVLGWPFQSRNAETTDSRFFVFIRADILRHASFADLRRLGVQRATAMRLQPGWPTVPPQCTP